MNNTALERAAAVWNRASEERAGKETGLYWLENPQIKAHINEKISGRGDVDWIDYTLQTFLEGKLPLERCLSLGCGEGRLERILAAKGVFRSCDAYDLADRAIAHARDQAAKAGFLQYLL